VTSFLQDDRIIFSRTRWKGVFILKTESNIESIYFQDKIIFVPSLQSKDAGWPSLQIFFFGDRTRASCPEDHNLHCLDFLHSSGDFLRSMLKKAKESVPKNFHRNSEI